ncbi:hypothetical protein CPB84DRAFT_1851504 [Gymnopilus junonius]|uniref:Ricin B lectin domain-containing protein n=1 Tax=Gymnopilus junonius TaxID=109634 RepID=A0A9P5NDB0_GYMJU|nr:hypothetical protein CPB84DRAFT_1851504 [Gymnopilus junonius]
MSNELSGKSETRHLDPGMYYVANNQNLDMALDLSGYDFATIIAYKKHGGDNQQWEFSKLGAVSWELEPDARARSLEDSMAKKFYVFNQPDAKGHIIQLNSSHPFKPTSLWRLIPVEPEKKASASDVLEFTTSAPKELKVEPPVITTADTIVDVEGLKLGGNGEMSITTTTTTVTTSVTKIKRLGIP